MKTLRLERELLAGKLSRTLNSWDLVGSANDSFMSVSWGETWWNMVKHGETWWNMVKHGEAWWSMVKRWVHNFGRTTTSATSAMHPPTVHLYNLMLHECKVQCEPDTSLMISYVLFYCTGSNPLDSIRTSTLSYPPGIKHGLLGNPSHVRVPKGIIGYIPILSPC